MVNTRFASASFSGVKKACLIVLACMSFTMMQLRAEQLAHTDTVILIDVDDVLMKPSTFAKESIKELWSIGYHADRPFPLFFKSFWWYVGQGGRAKLAALKEHNGTHALIEEIINTNPIMQQGTVYKGTHQPIEQALKDVVTTGVKVPEMYSLVERLKAQNYRVMYVTNLSPEVIDHNIVCGVLPRVEKVFYPFSYDGSLIKKPNVHFYRQVVEQLPANARIIVIDDHYENLGAARHVDLRVVAIMYKNPQQLMVELHNHGVYA